MPLTCGPTATAELLGVRGRYTSIFARDVDTDSSFELLEWIICYSIDHNKIPHVSSVSRVQRTVPLSLSWCWNDHVFTWSCCYALCWYRIKWWWLPALWHSPVLLRTWPTTEQSSWTSPTLIWQWLNRVNWRNGLELHDGTEYCTVSHHITSDVTFSLSMYRSVDIFQKTHLQSATYTS